MSRVCGFHDGMYSQASASKISTIEWISIHMVSRDKVMTASLFHGGISLQAFELSRRIGV
jgi:hypothetical protein